MPCLAAFALLAAAVSGEGTLLAGDAATRATAPVRASVRILPGVKVSLSSRAEDQGYKLNDARITLEDGSRRPAQLVEFQ